MSCNCTKTFVEGVKSDNTYFDVLNWYRNLYYKEDNRTVSNCVNNLICKYVAEQEKQEGNNANI